MTPAERLKKIGIDIGPNQKLGKISKSGRDYINFGRRLRHGCRILKKNTYENIGLW